MEKRKWLKISLVTVFIVLAGILYSCTGTNKQVPQLDLQNYTSSPQQELQATQEDSKVIQEDSKATQQDAKVTQRDTKETQEDAKETQAGKEVISQESEYIYIHICGAVKEPNVYEVEENSRLIDVIKLAGGLTEDAAGDYVNQAALVEDGQQIYIPTKVEVKGMTPSGYTVTESSNKESDKVNINTATMEVLMTLNGIGESKAKSIISYRQDNGGFKAIEDIKNINGIKDSVYNKICDLITVN